MAGCKANYGRRRTIRYHSATRPPRPSLASRAFPISNSLFFAVGFWAANDGSSIFFRQVHALVITACRVALASASTPDEVIKLPSYWYLLRVVDLFQSCRSTRHRWYRLTCASRGQPSLRQRRGRCRPIDLKSVKGEVVACGSPKHPAN